MREIQSENGFSCIALDNPKSPANVGGVCRAASVYGVALVVASGHRFRAGLKHSTDTPKAYLHIPMLHMEDVFDARPFNVTAVAVDILEGATPLPEFKHPERAFYVFGAEDATLAARITDQCQFTVVVPTRFCMNLASCVNVVLYDRMAKQWKREGEGEGDGS